MLQELVTPLSLIQPTIGLALAYISYLTFLKKIILKMYKSFAVRMCTVIVLISGIILLSVLSITDNAGYILFLKTRNKVDEYKIKYEVSKLSNQLDDVYKKIGQNVYNKQQIDGFINEAEACNNRLVLKQNEIVVLTEKFNEKVMFENTLKDLFKAEPETRCEAIRSLAASGKTESLPYLQLCLLEPDTQIHQEVEKAIDMINKQSIGGLSPQ